MNDYFSLISLAMAEGTDGGDAGAANTGVEQTGTITGAPGDDNGGNGDVNPLAGMGSMLLMLVLMGVVFYFMLIRPQRKKDKKVKEMLNSLKPGDRITTIGGIYGTIKSLRDDNVVLIIGQKNAEPTEMTIARWAIRNVEEITVENEGELLN